MYGCIGALVQLRSWIELRTGGVGEVPVVRRGTETVMEVLKTRRMEQGDRVERENGQAQMCCRSH